MFEIVHQNINVSSSGNKNVVEVNVCFLFDTDETAIRFFNNPIDIEVVPDKLSCNFLSWFWFFVIGKLGRFSSFIPI